VNLLVLGGTRFLGRHFVAAALARGHEVTLFNRGRTNPELFPEASRIVGDRAGDLHELEGRAWDAVVDINGYFPEVVAASVKALRDRAGSYCFVSTIAVYADHTRPGLTEDSPLHRPLWSTAPKDRAAEDAYGRLKSACEAVVLETWGDKALVVRPGLIVGPCDMTGRFTYWVTRAARGGNILAPGKPSSPVQIIDVRDLAGWMIQSIERQASGVFQATGPAAPLDLGGVLDVAAAILGGESRLTWVDEDFLLERGVVPFTELPLWVSGPIAGGFFRVDCAKAIAAGLSFRALSATIADTLGSVAPQLSPIAGQMTPEREAALLAEWHGHAAS
jgi:2'-hydroxyisoflavone reductase